MSSRRSRFKIAANIPVRRKIASTQDSQPENEKCFESPVKTETESPVQGPIASENTPNHCERSIPCISITSSPAKGSNLKLSKANVQIPIRKHLLGDEIVKVENQVGDDVNSVLLKNEKVNNINEQANVATQQDRPKTPPSSLLCASLSGVLKSPIRARFVRPSLVDAANRRHSFHVSSASESEDESRRLQNVSKTRKLSESCTKSENSNLVPQSTDKCIDGLESVECARLALMPKRRRAKVSNFVRKIAEARRDFKKKFAREKPERSKLTMFDLIFYNPGSKNCIESCELKDDAIKSHITQDETLQEEVVDDPVNDESDCQDEAAVPVPQVKIGANGEIILDEKSLVIETTEAKKGREALMNAVPVFEDKNRRVSYFGKRKSSVKEWSPIETKCFYKALNSLGTDFAMMQALFPDRTRAELKNKFKREDRINSQLIDIALLNPAAFNINLLKEQLDVERTLVERETKRQIEEKAKTEQLRKETLNKKKKLSQDENQCISSLKNFIETEEILPKKPRSSRGAQRRKLCEDFVDPFQVSDDNFTRFKKPCAIRINKESNINAYSKATGIEPIVTTKFVSKPGRPKKSNEVIEKTIVYYPDEQNNSDSDSISSLNFNEKTEEIGNHEFVELINRNIQNLEQTTIRFLAPSPSNVDNTNIRVVLDVSSDKVNKKTHLPLVEGESSAHVAEEYGCVKIKDDSLTFSRQQLKTAVRPELVATVPDSQFEVIIDNLNELHETEEDIGRNYSEQLQVNQSSKLQHSSTSSVIMKNDVTEESVDSIDNEVPGLFEGPIILDDEPHERDSIPPFLFESNDSNSRPSKTDTDSGLISTEEDSVEKRTSGGFQYTVIKSGTTSEQKRTYLAGLTPGSFVFMATETSAPLEQRCSMYMISEKISPDGDKEFVPLPVFLPPELMKLISNDMK